MTMIDKTNGNILYKPYFPLPAIYTPNNEDYGKMLEDHTSAEMYIIENGVSKESYDEFMRWKNRLTEVFLLNAYSVCRAKGICLYDFYQALKYEAKRNEFSSCNSFVDYNEWNW